MVTKTQRKPLTKAHKSALADGRRLALTVDRYLTSLNTPKQRGRRVPLATLRTRRASAVEEVKNKTGLAKLLASQEVRDLNQAITRAEAAGNGDKVSPNLEKDFIRVAKAFGEKRGIVWGAWRDAGVPAAVLAKAGVPRTRDNRT